MAQTVQAYNPNCEILCISHAHTIWRVVKPIHTTIYGGRGNYKMFQTVEYNYKQPKESSNIGTLYGIDIFECNILPKGQIFLFPYLFENGFPIVKGKSGIIDFY
jgi:hypothetical protein